MRRSLTIIACVVMCLSLSLTPVLAAPPRGPIPPDPAIEARAILEAQGYQVLEVGYIDDEQTTVAVLMSAASSHLDAVFVQQLADGWTALHGASEVTPYLWTIIEYTQPYWLVFAISARDWNDWGAGRIPADEFWNRVGYVVYDTQRQAYVEDQDQINKTISPDYTPESTSPAPTAAGKTLSLEPSTTYLPADGRSELKLIARVAGGARQLLAGERITFDAKARDGHLNTNAAITDPNGVAYGSFVAGTRSEKINVSARVEDDLSSATLLVGTPPRDTEAAWDAVAQAMKVQGYELGDHFYAESASLVGDVEVVAGLLMAPASNQLDRAFYSQIERAVGTMRTVFPASALLRPILVYDYGDTAYLVVFDVKTLDWDAWVNGSITEDQLWNGVTVMVIDANTGEEVSTTDFIHKNFTDSSGGANEVSQVVLIESSLVAETWGEQLYFDELIVPAGGTVDNWAIQEMSGSATGFVLYESGNLLEPVFRWRKGDGDAALRGLTLSGGLYILQIEAGSAPARVQLRAIEHRAL